MPRAVPRHFTDNTAELLGLDQLALPGDRLHLEVAKLLLERDLLSLTQLATAMRLRASHRTGLAETIIAQGVDPEDYYRIVAELYGLRFVDLAAEPADPRLFVGGLADRSMRPWREEDGRLMIVTAALSREHIEWADARFGEDGYDFVIAVPAKQR